PPCRRRTRCMHRTTAGQFPPAFDRLAAGTALPARRGQPERTMRGQGPFGIPGKLTLTFGSLPPPPRRFSITRSSCAPVAGRRLLALEPSRDVDGSGGW